MSLKPNSIRTINASIITNIRNAVEELSYGSVTITVHDKKITQVEIVHKKRFDDFWKVEEQGDP